MQLTAVRLARVSIQTAKHAQQLPQIAHDEAVFDSFLQVLVELAHERDEDIPALVYEARSTRQPRRLHGPRQQQQQQQRVPRQQQHGNDSAALQGVMVTETGAASPGHTGQSPAHQDFTRALHGQDTGTT